MKCIVIFNSLLRPTPNVNIGNFLLKLSLSMSHLSIRGAFLEYFLWTQAFQTMNLDDACRYLGYWGTGNGDMRATKEVVRQKIIATRDLITCHPLTPELATELFTSKGMGVFRFSAALIEWSESELNDVKQLCVQAYKNAWHLSQSTASTLFIFPKTHAGKESTLPMAVLTQELLLLAERCMRHEDVSKKSCWQA